MYLDNILKIWSHIGGSSFLRCTKKGPLRGKGIWRIFYSHLFSVFKSTKQATFQIQNTGPKQVPVSTEYVSRRLIKL